MTSSLVDNMNLVNKIYFPREVLPIAAMLARLVDFAIAGALFLGDRLVPGHPGVRPAGLLMLPVVVLVQMALVVGIGLTAAA